MAAPSRDSSGAHVEESPLGEVELFILSGEFDAYSAPMLEQQLGDAIERGRHEFVLEMHAVGFIDLSTVNVIARALKAVYRHNGHLDVASTSRPVVRAIDLAGMRHAIRVFPTREEALERLRERAPSPS